MNISPRNNIERLKENREIVRCPKCHSVFIENDVCESCSFRLNFKPLGEPLGNKSYFAIVREFNSSRNIIFQLIPLLEKFIETSSRREFERQFLFRLNLLIEHIADIEDPQEYKLFMFELKEIIKEASKRKIKLNKFEKKIESTFGVAHPLYQDIMCEIIEVKGKFDLKLIRLALKALVVLSIVAIVFLIFEIIFYL